MSAATDLDLISFLKAIPDARMRRGVRIPAWYLLLVAVLGILSKCESLRDLAHQSQEGFRACAQGCDEKVDVMKRLAITPAGAHELNDRPRPRDWCNSLGTSTPA